MSEDKIKLIKRKRNWSHDKFIEFNLKSYKYIAEREKEIFSDGIIEGKVKDLIALGIALIGNCESCIQYHIEDAICKGATHEEILEVIDLAMFEGGSIAVIPSRFALEVLENVKSRDISG